MTQRLSPLAALPEDLGSVPHPQGSSQLFATPVPGDLMPTFGFLGYQEHMEHMHNHAGKILIHKTQQFLC